MENLFDVLTDEGKSLDDFQWWVYAIVAPLALVAIIALAGWMETLV